MGACGWHASHNEGLWQRRGEPRRGSLRTQPRAALRPCVHPPTPHSGGTTGRRGFRGAHWHRGLTGELLPQGSAVRMARTTEHSARGKLLSGYACRSLLRECAPFPKSQVFPSSALSPSPPVNELPPPFQATCNNAPFSLTAGDLSVS